MHLSVGLYLADWGVDGGGAQVSDAAEEEAHNGCIIGGRGEWGGRGGEGLMVYGGSFFFVPCMVSVGDITVVAIQSGSFFFGGGGGRGSALAL